ncbi:MAG: hypothetical protein HC899_23555 [Leptolyngbyaceae cyanobacterium SM1_4_3]|nr:hypothetical protein [Leptolyngbyaceae cyanobacterium SM1_4_3]
MSNFLNNLVARNNNQLEMIQPRIPSLFEPNMVINFTQNPSINDPSVQANISEPLGHSTNQVVEVESRSIPPQEKTQIAREFPKHNNWERTEYITHNSEESPKITNEFSSPPQSPISFLEKTQMKREFQGQNGRENHEYIFTRDTDESPTNLTVEHQNNFVTNNYLHRVEIRNHKSSEPKVIQQSLAKETFTKEIFTPKESKTQAPEIHSLIPQQPPAKIVEQVIPIIEKSPILKETPPTQTLITPAQISPKITVVKQSQPILEKPEAAPTININIGRIEVRATTSTTVSKSVKPRVKPAVMSLDEYLDQRGGGK